MADGLFSIGDYLKDQSLDQYRLFDILEEDESTWRTVRRYPNSITARLQVRLTNWAVANPERWRIFQMYHLMGLSQQTIAEVEGISQQMVSKYLEPVNLSSKEDFPIIEEEF